MRPVIVIDDPYQVDAATQAASALGSAMNAAVSETDPDEIRRRTERTLAAAPPKKKPAPPPKGKLGSKFQRRLAKHRKPNRFARGGDQMPRERSDEAPLPYVCAVQVKRVDDRGRVTTKTSRPRRRRR